MSLSQALQIYSNLNLLILIGFAVWKGLDFVSKWVKQPWASSQLLRWQYLTIGGIFLICGLQPFFPKAQFFEPPVQQWAPVSKAASTVAVETSDVIGISSAAKINSKTVVSVWFWIAALLFLISAGWMLRDWYRLYKIQKNSYRIRSLRKVNIFVHEQIQVPFSFWWPGRRQIVLPMRLLSRSQDLKMAALHELQHHRQGDTQWVYAMWFLRWFCFWNPAVYLWNQWLCELQEFACDETLVDLQKVPSQDYARCLVEVAQTTVRNLAQPVCASGLIFITDRQLLRRRIEKMCEGKGKAKTKRRSIGVCLAVGLSALFAISAFAASGWVQDRRVTMAQAEAMAEKARVGNQFPVVLNDQVLAELNRYLGTQEGREFMRNALQRLETHRSVVEAKIQKYGLPTELLAIPIVESGYENLPERPSSKIKSAGIWQFIRQTARNFGLKVDPQTDERLNVTMETDAAMRYLNANALRFNDWQLAVQAYNMGEANVQNAIEKVGSRNVWDLIRAGYEGDRHYLAKVHAAILILRNPESLN